MLHLKIKKWRNEEDVTQSIYMGARECSFLLWVSLLQSKYEEIRIKPEFILLEFILSVHRPLNWLCWQVYPGNLQSNDGQSLSQVHGPMGTSLQIGGTGYCMKQYFSTVATWRCMDFKSQNQSAGIFKFLRLRNNGKDKKTKINETLHVNLFFLNHFTWSAGSSLRMRGNGLSKWNHSGSCKTVVFSFAQLFTRFC